MGSGGIDPVESSMNRGHRPEHAVETIVFHHQDNDMLDRYFVRFGHGGSSPHAIPASPIRAVALDVGKNFTFPRHKTASRGSGAACGAVGYARAGLPVDLRTWPPHMPSHRRPHPSRAKTRDTLKDVPDGGCGNR
jgi:hypothetical protein